MNFRHSVHKDERQLIISANSSLNTNPRIKWRADEEEEVYSRRSHLFKTLTCLMNQGWDCTHVTLF